MINLNNMKTSKLGIDLLKEFEGCSSKVKGKNVILDKNDIKNNILVYPYYCSAKHLTIGFGSRVYDNKGKLLYGSNFENGITVKECDEIFFKILKQDYEEPVNRWLKVNVNQNQFDALVCLCYNRPIWAKEICVMMNKGKSIEEIKIKWLKFSTVGGVVNNGILKRRQKELELFLKV